MGTCGFESCQNEAIVKANGVLACQDHLDWVFERAFAGVREIFRALRRIAEEPA